MHRNLKIVTPPETTASTPLATRTQALFRAGLALHQRGQLAQALEVYHQVLGLQARHFDTLYMLGVLAGQTGNSAQAVQWIDKAIEIDPNYASAYSNRGNALNDLKQHQAAIDSYNQAIAIKPDHVDAYYNRGLALYELKQYQAAIDSYDKAVALRPGHAQACYNRGLALYQLKQYQAAIDSYRQATAIRPEHAQAYYNLGLAFAELKQHQAALDSYDQAIAIKPDYVEAYSNRGSILSDLGLNQAALDSYDHAIALRPDDAEGHWNQSLCHLQMGAFEPGWAKYEWRWKTDKIESFKDKRDFPQPLWLGQEPLLGKTILLHSEQGLGDTLQFCRYAKLVRDLGASVILEVQRPLLTLLAQLDGVTALLATDERPPAFHYHCPMLSLPLAFGTKLDTIPAPDAYLRSAPDKVRQWKARLGDLDKPCVGLVWRGNPKHKNDANRSIALSDLTRFLPGHLRYVSLQKELGEADMDSLKEHPEILHCEDELKDFSDTAALCELVDVVISVDTSVAHLAGALGKPVWIVLPFNPDWRWLLDRSDSPWYRSARLYRQTAPGDWAGVLGRVAADLERTFSPPNPINKKNNSLASQASFQ